MSKFIKKAIACILSATFISGIISNVTVLNIVPAIAYAEEIPGWGIANNGGQDLTVNIDRTTVHSGKAAVHLSYTTEGGDNVYAQFGQTVAVEPNTTYIYSMWVKAKNLGNVQSLISWGERYNINSLGNTFEWKKFEFSWFSGNSTSAEFQLIANSSVKDMWIDDLSFCKKGSNKNLFQNPGIEDGITDDTNIPDDNEEPEQLEDKSTSIKDFGEEFLNSRYLPLFKESIVNIDGDLSDWKNAVPVSGSGNGVNASLMSAYDEKYFYLAVETEDEVHSASVSGTGTWQYDSVQFVVGTSEEAYGRQVNVSFDKDGPLYFYSEQWHDSDIQKIKSFGRHYDGISYYEMAIPWELLGTSYEKNNLLMDVLVNDNDNDKDGRKYFEFTSGIGTTKINEDFLHIHCIENQDFISEVIAPSKVITDKNEKCGVLLMNNSDSEKNVNVVAADGTTAVSISANSAYLHSFYQSFDLGDKLFAKIKVDTDEVEINKNLNIERSRERILSDSEILENEYLPELNELIAKCEEKNIPVDYEKSDREMINFYISRIAEDIDHDLDFRAEYILNSLMDMYKRAKSNLNAYLSGEAEAPTTYKYVTSPLQIDGQSVIADTVNSKTGEIEKRPVYLNGYNSFSDGSPVDYYADMGFNALAIEVGINNLIIQPGGTHGWTELNRKDDTTTEIVYEKGDSGNSVLKIVSNSDAAANKYLQFYQSYSVKPNTTYEFGLRAKGKNVNKLWFSIGGWETERKYLPDGDYDWRDFSYEYTTSDSQTSFEFFVFADGRIDEAMIDDVYVREKGTSKNLLSNGNFETARSSEVYRGMIFEKSRFDGYKEIFKNAKGKDVSLTLQIATHYWPYFTTSNDSANTIQGHFTGDINYSSERVREVTEYFLKNLLEEIKDEPALNSLIMGNEPGYCTLGNAEFYEPVFREYLKRIYDNDISKLNKNYKSDFKGFEDITFNDVKGGDTQNWLSFGIDLSKYEPTPIFYDWVNFNYAVYEDWAAFLYNTVKKYAPNVKLHIKQLAGTWRYNHDYFRQWLRNGVNAEMLAGVTDFNGCDAQGILNNEEQNISTKMRWYDYLTSIKDTVIFNSEDHSVPDDSDNLSPSVAKWMGATTWLGAIHGCTMNTTWVWSTSYDKGGLYGSVMVRPDAASAQARANLDLNRLGFEVKAITDAKANVAVLDTLSSQCLDRIYENVSYNAWQSSIYSGQRTDFITEKQCAEGKLGQYKVLLVPKCDRASKKTLLAIRDFASNGGKVIMLGEDCLKADEYGNSFNSSEYEQIYQNAKVIPITWEGLAMITPTNKEIRDILRSEYESLGMNNVRLVNVETGETVYDVEWESVPYENGTLISINNYNWKQNPEVAIEINGRRASEFTELRNREKKQGKITLNPYEPVLIRVDN